MKVRIIDNDGIENLANIGDIFEARISKTQLGIEIKWGRTWVTGLPRTSYEECD